MMVWENVCVMLKMKQTDEHVIEAADWAMSVIMLMLILMTSFYSYVQKWKMCWQQKMTNGVVQED